MTSDEIRERYVKFFEKKGHAKIEPAPLVLENDPTTLFTSAGMQPLIPYLKGELHPKGKRLVNIQPSLRLQDIEEVGDLSHTTFFEMLGNWSLGDYFKKEQLEWCWEFFTKELGLDPERLYVSVFEGTNEVSKDTESAEAWKGIGVPEDRIFYYGVDKNWWSRSGSPDSMPTGEIGGPDSEVFFEFEDAPHNKKFGEKCHPNCQCGRFMEIGNSVFIQYEKKQDGSLKELPQKNVDFGGGLERIAAAVNGQPDIFKIDIFAPTMELLEKETGIEYGLENSKSEDLRIIADHLRASVAIASEGVYPGNKLQSYVLRRLIRRAATKIRQITSKSAVELIGKISQAIKKDASLENVIKEEVGKFEKVLLEGERQVKQNPQIDPFELYQSFGIPYEISKDIFSGAGRKLSAKDEKGFEKKLAEHQEKSRGASAGMFKGGLADSSEVVTKLHTATHLLHTALRKVLGEGVAQKGSNITAERLRFDFSYPEKLTDEEIKKVENIINEVMDKDLPVSFETKTLDEAIEEGALHFFGERYGKEVKVYTVGDPEGEWFSKEVCGGPHVKNTKAIGHVRIVKQENVGSGTVRVYATNKPE
jgi:alanyl-tRNA synthetase